MTQDLKRQRAKLRRPGTKAYEIGYGKPPQSRQFKVGQSGNPRGRPKDRGGKSPVVTFDRLKTIITAEAYRTVKINDGNRQMTVSMAEAIVRSLAVSAAKGHARSQRLFTDLLAMVERDMKAARQEWLETAIGYKAFWERELERRKTLGIDAPDPIPHPNDILIDFVTDEVVINGPMTKEQKVVWDRLRERLAQCDKSIAELEVILNDPGAKAAWPSIRKELRAEREVRAALRALVG
jgi:Family of unknown function (DUF5681)